MSAVDRKLLGDIAQSIALSRVWLFLGNKISRPDSADRSSVRSGF